MAHLCKAVPASPVAQIKVDGLQAIRGQAEIGQAPPEINPVVTEAMRQQRSSKEEKKMANKKNWLVLLMTILVLGGAFALPRFGLSAGGGGFVDMGLGGGYEFSNSSGQSTKVEAYMPALAGGGNAFFDATFVELSLGFSGGFGRFLIRDGDDLERVDFSITKLNISLLGKYPFEIGTKWAIFPLLGIDYQLMLSVKGEDEYEIEASDFNALWFKLGAGFDCSFTEQIYLRFSTLYGIRLPNQFEIDAVDRLDANVLLGQGLTARLAIGYRF